MANKSLKIALNFNGPIQNFDPHRISNLVDAHLARNLYSRLITLEDDGQIKGELAEDFFWNGKSYVIKLRPGLQTIDGHPITAEDAYTSLLRNIHNGKVSHGNLRDFLCPNYQVDGICRGLEVKDGNLILTPALTERHAFLLPILASTDFSIIPKKSLDLNDPNWKIIDFRNTSGVYFVEESLQNGQMKWQSNPSHFNVVESTFSTVDVVPLSVGPDSLAAFQSGAVDFLPTSSGMQLSALEKLGPASIHQSHNIRLVYAAFTEKGHAKLSSNDKLALAAALKQVAAHRIHRGNGTDTNQIFPPDSEGALSRESEQSYVKLIGQHEGKAPSHPVRLAVGQSLYEDLKAALAAFPWINVEIAKSTSQIFSASEAQPDAFILHGDTSFYESISMIHYYFSMGVFGQYSEGRKWLDQYLSIPDKSERLKKLSELHRQLLTEGTFIPLYTTPYLAIARKPIRMNISKFYAGTPMWKVFRN